MDERKPRPVRGGGDDDLPVQPGPPKRGRRWPWVVTLLLLIVFLAFGGVVWLAYQDGAGAGGEVPLITADARPFKVAPDDPGGLEVPNQRLSVNVLLGSEPPADDAEPLPPAPAAPQTPVVAPAPPRPEPPAAATEPPPPAVARAEPQPSEPTPAPTASPPAPAAPPAPAPVARATPPAAPPAAADEAAGAEGFRIQLAAVSDEERARRAWDELRASYREVLGGLEPRIQRAEIGDSVFFRIQAGPFGDRGAAEAACAALKARQAACIVVSR